MAIEIDALVAVTFDTVGIESQKFWEGLPRLGIVGLSLPPTIGRQMVIFTVSDLPVVIEHADSCGLKVDDLREEAE